MASDDLNLKVKFTIDTGSFKEVDDAIRKMNERAGRITVSGGGTRSQPSQAAREPSRNKQAEIEAYKKGYEEQKKTLEGIIRAQDPAKKIDPVFRGLKNQLADINNGIRRGRAMGEDVSEAKGKQQAVKEEIERGKQILATKEQVRETGFLNVLTKKWRQSITGVLIDLHVLRIVGQSSKVVSAMFEVLSKSIGYVVDMALLPALPFLLDFASLIRELGHWIAELNPTTKKMIGVAVLLVGGFFVMLNTVRSVINSLIWFKLALDSASKSSLGRTVSDKVAGGGAIAGAAKFGAAGMAGVLATIGLGTLYMKMAKAAGWDKVDPTFSKSVAQSPFGMFAAGGLLKSGQAAVVGEKGPELLIPGSGGYNVVPNNGLRFLAEGTTPSILDSFLGLITGGITGFIGKFSDIASTVVSGIFGKSILGGGVDTGVGLTTGDSERQLLAKGFSGTITASTSGFKNANTLLAAILAALLNPIGKLADLLTPDSPVPIRASALWELVWDKVLIPLKNVWDLTWSVVDVLADELWHLVIDPVEYTADQLWKLAEPIVDIIPFPWKLGHPATTEVPFPWKLATLSAAAATISFPWVLLGPLVKEVAFPWVLQAPADTTIDWPYTVEKPTTTLKITTWYEVFTTPTAVLLRWADVFTKPAPVTTLTWYDVITLPVAMVLGWKDILILPVAMAISSWEEVFDTPDVPIVYDNWSSIISLPPPLNKEWYEIFKFGTSFPYVLYWSQVFKLPDVPQAITAGMLYAIQPVTKMVSELFSFITVPLFGAEGTGAPIKWDKVAIPVLAVAGGILSYIAGMKLLEWGGSNSIIALPSAPLSLIGPTGIVYTTAMRLLDSASGSGDGILHWISKNILGGSGTGSILVQPASALKVLGTPTEPAVISWDGQPKPAISDGTGGLIQANRRGFWGDILTNFSTVNLWGGLISGNFPLALIGGLISLTGFVDAVKEGVKQGAAAAGGTATTTTGGGSHTSVPQTYTSISKPQDQGFKYKGTANINGQNVEVYSYTGSGWYAKNSSGNLESYGGAVSGISSLPAATTTTNPASGATPTNPASGTTPTNPTSGITSTNAQVKTSSGVISTPVFSDSNASWYVNSAGTPVRVYPTQVSGIYTTDQPSSGGGGSSGGGSSTPVVTIGGNQSAGGNPTGNGYNFLAAAGGKWYGMTRNADGDNAGIVELTNTQFNDVLKGANTYNTPVFDNTAGTGTNLNDPYSTVLFPYQISDANGSLAAGAAGNFKMATKRVKNAFSARDYFVYNPNGNMLLYRPEPYSDQMRFAATVYPYQMKQMMAGSLSERIPGLALGGTAMASGLAWVGERGRELMHLPRGAEVIPHTPSVDLMAKQTKPQVIDKSVHYHIDGNTFQVSGKDERQLFEEFMKLMERESRRVRG